MAKSRTKWILGVGCFGVVVVMGLVALLVLASFGAPSLPGRIVLGITLDGPITEVTVEDPFAQLLGEQPLSMRDLRKALIRAAEDDRVEGLRLRVDSFGGGLAGAQELRSLIARFQATGKWTAAYMDTAGEFSAGNLEYLVASSCEKVSLNPLGDVNLIGLSARTPFLRGSLDKLGIEPSFPGRKEYKSARFMFTHTGFTPAEEEMMGWLMDDIMEQLVGAVASSRGLEPAEVRHLISRAPFFGQEAADVKLVDELEDWGAFCERIEARRSTAARTVGLSRYLRSLPAEHGPKIAVITASGSIMTGESRRSFNPISGGEVMGAETIAKAWRKARELRGLKAVLFRVDSPGGSVVASEIVRQEMARTAAKVPVVVSMASVAGSGGYWITCGATRIVADPATLTGSIGVYAGHLNMKELYTDKLGITFGEMDRGANADLYGDLASWTPEQEQVIERMLDRIYNAFLERVADARGMTVEQVDELAGGRVFTGTQALERGLVDVIGGFDEALEETRKLAGLDPGAPVTLVDLPQPKPIWMQMLEAGRHDEEALDTTSASLRQWLQTGVVQTPGTVWMPPIWIR